MSAGANVSPRSRPARCTRGQEGWIGIEHLSDAANAVVHEMVGERLRIASAV